MFEHCRKYTKWLTLILLSMFFVTFVIDDYGVEPRKMKGVCTECFTEMDVDETECEEDELAEEACIGQYAMEIQGIICVFRNSMHLSSSKQSFEQFRGLVRRYAPRPILNDIELFKNGIDLLLRFMPFLFETQITKLWTILVFLLQS